MTGSRRRGPEAERRARERRRRARRRERQSAVLRALTTSALALPGFAGNASADSPVLDISADYSFGQYREARLPRDKMADPTAENRRYEVDLHQVRLASPIGDSFDVALDVSHETMSGASPWYTIPGADGKPLQVMSGATISDQRTDAVLSSSYFMDTARAGATARVSYEKDYLAFGGGLNGEKSFREGNTTLLGGANLSFDRIRPTDADLFDTRVEQARRESYSGYIGVSQVMTRRSAVQATLTYQHARGFLSDPYKLAYVAGDTVADSRPGQRHQLTLLTRYRHHIERFNGTLHFDYRFYIDDWNINSHTFELAWFQSLFDRIQIVPSLRYYSQSGAKFYAPYFDERRNNKLYTSDFRLSPYGAFAWRVKAETYFNTWKLRWKAHVGWESYSSGGNISLHNVPAENPGLVSYTLFSAGLTTRF